MEPAPESAPLLLVDDDADLRRLLQMTLEREGHAVVALESRQAAGWLETHRPTLLLLGLKLKETGGSSLLERLTQNGNCPPFVMITGPGDERAALAMMKRGALDYLVKDGQFLERGPAVVARSLAQLEKERRLAQAEQQVRLVQGVVEQGFNGVLIADADGTDPRVLYINPAFSQATGYHRHEIVGRRLSEIAGLDHARQLIRGFSPGTRFSEALFSYRSASGERWGEWRVGPVKDPEGRLTHWLVNFRDITDQRRLEREILEISDRERQRLGQDLHDGVCQQLAGIELMSQVLRQRLERRSKSAAAQAASLAEHVRDAIGQARSLARGLAPVTLESEGLVSALRELAANTERLFGIVCEVRCDDQAPAPDRAVAIHLYRIAQEAVFNALKHGRARGILVTLQPGGDQLQLCVSDDGGGLPDPLPANRGMGLSIMRYRAGIIGGSLSITNKHPREGPGVQVICSTPLTPHQFS